MAVSAANAQWILSFFHDRLGDPYVYGGVWNPNNTRQGADCSGVVGTVLECLTKGPQRMSWGHVVSTESWHYNYQTNSPAPAGSVGPYGTIAVSSLADVPPDAALIVNIMHGGGGEDSHMNCVLQGTIIESNGGHGTCTNNTGAYAANASLWTDHWYLPGPIVSTPTSGAPYVNNKTDTLYADVSEFQCPVNDSYTDAGYRVLAIRSNDGSYQDHNFSQNYQWCVNAVNDGRLDFFIVYYYWRPDGTGSDTHISMVTANGGPHPKMVSMIDVEKGSGNGSANRSTELNREFFQVAGWLANGQSVPARVIGYGNKGDLDSIWPNKPEGIHLVLAGYGENPTYPGKIAHQYTDGNGYGRACGLPDGAAPFGNCDMNSADGLSSVEFAHACGLGGSVLTPPPSPQPASPPPPAPRVYTVRPGDTLSNIAARNGVSLNTLLAANPQIANPNLIYPGETINLPTVAAVKLEVGTPEHKPVELASPVVAHQAEVDMLRKDVERLLTADAPPAPDVNAIIEEVLVKIVPEIKSLGEEILSKIEVPIPDPPSITDFTKADARSRATQTLLVGMGLSAVWGAIDALGSITGPENWFNQNSWVSVLSLMGGAALTAAGNYFGRLFKEPVHQAALPAAAKASAATVAAAAKKYPVL